MTPWHHDKSTSMRRAWLIAAGWLLLVAVAQAGSVSVHAFLDRTYVSLGDTVTLNIEVDGSSQAATPDVSALRSDFEILGTSRNLSVSIVNGQRKVTELWAVQLRPLHVGIIRIPALTVDGQTTAPLALAVKPASAVAQGQAGGPVFVEVQPSTLTPYVGQQIDLDVKLFYAPNVDSGSLNVPHGKNVRVREMGNGVRYQSELDGHFYQVLEKHYAVTAVHAGPLNLAPVVFQGTMTTAGNFGGFFGQGKSISAQSGAVHLAVRARPAASGKGQWLPARNLRLQLSGLPADGHLMVGQVLTVSLTEMAEGLPFESLPEPRLPALSGVDVYPDQPQDHTGSDGRWLTGTRTRKFALVVQQAGTLTIPAITLDWWNVKTNRQEVASIPAHTFTVIAAAGSSGQTAPGLPASAVSAATAPIAKAPVSHATESASVAMARPSTSSTSMLTWLALGLWLVTALVLVGVWSWKRRRQRPKAAPAATTRAPALATSGRRGYQAFAKAVADGDVAAQCDSLLAWARAERPALRHLGELAQALDSPAQCAAIAALQRARYADAGHGSDAADLRDVFKQGLVWRTAPDSATTSAALPPLYP
ncbi:MAG TPA: BatD family protein [Rhodanobacteraceae bacterium]